MRYNVYLDTDTGRLLVGPFTCRDKFKSVHALTAALLEKAPNLKAAIDDGKLWIARKGTKMEYAPCLAERDPRQEPTR